MPRRLPGRAIQAGTITVTQLETTVANTVQTGGGPKITNVQVTSNSYVVLDDTAVDIAGGYIKITGTGFAAGCQVLINNTPATSTTYIGPTEVRAQLPASSAGTYMLYVINADGGVAIRVNGVTFSATPSWVTASDLTSYALGDAISIQLAATGASTFALAAGSTLPTGLTLSAGGLLSGSVTGLENDTSYSFTITATDAENQDSPRTFTISITVQLQVSRSLRFNRSDTAYLTRTFAVNGDRQRWTWSGWIKRSSLGTLQNIINSVNVTPIDGFYFDTNDTLKYRSYNGTSENVQVITTQVFRDTSSWYHLVVALDTTQATAANRLRMYINGSEITAFSTATYPTQNFLTGINLAGTTELGSYAVTNTFNGYMTEVYFIDGQQLTPAAFAETNTTTGQYIPKKYTGTYGTNGFYLPFTDNSSVLNLGRNYQPLTADPFWNRTVLLLNGTGTNNANNNTFTDSSANAFAITRNGNVSQGRFSPFTQGGWSNYLNSTSGNYISVSASNAFDVGTNDFTVELWFYINPGATSYNGWGRAHILGGAEATGSSRIALIVNGSSLGSSGLTWNVGSTSGSYATAIPQGQWHHAALIRSGTAITLYLNGSAVSTGTSSASIANNIQHIGAFRATDDQFSDYFYGYISNVRFIKNQAVYSGSTVGTKYFTPSTSPLTTTSIGSTGAGVAASITGTVSLLTCQSNRFLDQTSKTITLTGSPSVVSFSPFTPTTAYSAATHGGSAYFDGTGDYLQLPITALTGQFTIEFWFYRAVTGNNFMFTIGDSLTATGSEIYIGTNGTILNYYTGQAARITATPPDVGSWSYIAATRDSSNVVRLYVNGTQVGGTYTHAATLDTTLRVGAEYYSGAISGITNGYIANFRISNTVRTITVPTQPLVNDANTLCLLDFTNAGIVDATGDNNIETVGDAKISTAQSKWAGSSMAFDGTGDWLQLPASDVYAFGSGDYTVEAWVYFTSINNTNLQIIFGSGAAGGNSFFFSVDVDQISVGTSAAYISNQATSFTTGQWYHVVACRSGTTLRLFVNGTQAGSNVTDTTNWTSSGNARVGANSIGTQTVFGYIQDLRITRAARYTGNFTPPTAQFAYNQGDINYNQWVPTNFSITAGAGNDSLLDVPTNWGVDTGLGGEVRGNYCVGNWANSNDPSGYLTDGGLRWAVDNTRVITGTFGMSEGKWYCEATPFAIITTLEIGIIATSISWPSTNFNSPGAYANGYTYLSGGNKYNNNSSTAYGASYTTNDVIGIAFDADARTMTFYKNGVSQGTAFSAITAGSYVICARATGVGSSGFVMNFGQRPFAYAAPSGFKSLNTHNLPALAVTKSNTAFDAKAFTGNGTSLTVSEFGFTPDLVWIKGSSTSYSHYLFDTIRGATKMLYSESTSQEDTGATSLTAFTSNGFTVGTNIGVNNNATSHIAWAWDAGTTTVVNNSGSVSSDVRVNTSAGISIVSYAGSQASTFTIGHGLLSAPSFIITKSRNAVGDWGVYYTNEGVNTNWLLLNSTASKGTQNGTLAGGAYLISNAQTLQISSSAYANGSSQMIAYCFAAVPGFSSFGTYTGNGSADGPFVYTGFRPRFIIVKNSSSAGVNWLMFDTATNTYNTVTKYLLPNSSSIELTDLTLDIVSNGFKPRVAGGTGINNSGSTYIYAAFAESPFKYARAR